jgi:hypothetical protein
MADDHDGQFDAAHDAAPIVRELPQSLGMVVHMWSSHRELTETAEPLAVVDLAAVDLAAVEPAAQADTGLHAV